MTILKDPQLNPTISDLLCHCGTGFLRLVRASPAAERRWNAILQVKRRVRALLRHWRYFSFAEVNRAMHPLLDALNGRHM